MSQLEPADFIICFKGAESEHVYIVYKKLAGGDYLVFTHGDDSCPKFEKLSSVLPYWNSIGRVVGCRTLPVTPNYKWTVLNGKGDVLARTSHPVRYALRHPRAFRTHGWIKYRRDVV